MAVGDNYPLLYSAKGSDGNNSVEEVRNITVAPTLEVIAFGWSQSSDTVGESVTFEWNVEHVSSCAGTMGDSDTISSYGVAEPSQNLVFYSTGIFKKQWYCSDLTGGRYPTDPSQFLESEIEISKLPAPAELKEVNE
ncbi:hypothetical protein [Paraglaciecola sp.]|uniref:hypothetical protein n=1 Tax=Paraglaciecola sp. TaxID=1920173 RepID=UPI003EF1D91F